MQLNHMRSGRRCAISLTPLIDVVFILLLFFMLASNFTEWRSIALNAPAARAAAAVSAQAVLVRVHDDGGIDLNGTALPLEMLDQRLQPLLQRNPNQAVIVRPDAEVALQVLVRVLDRLNAGGARSITLHEN